LAEVLEKVNVSDCNISREVLEKADWQKYKISGLAVSELIKKVNG
jgi:hypothetical protein